MPSFPFAPSLPIKIFVCNSTLSICSSLPSTVIHNSSLSVFHSQDNYVKLVLRLLLLSLDLNFFYQSIHPPLFLLLLTVTLPFHTLLLLQMHFFSCSIKHPSALQFRAFQCAGPLRLAICCMHAPLCFSHFCFLLTLFFCLTVSACFSICMFYFLTYAMIQIIILLILMKTNPISDTICA